MSHRRAGRDVHARRHPYPDGTRGRVAEVLTTSRSPGCSRSGRSWTCGGSSPSGAGHQHPALVAGQTSRFGGVVASRLGREFERPDGAQRRSAGSCRSAARKRPLGRSVVEQREQRRARRSRGLGTVGDVLAGEGVLVHLRAHVTGVDRVHAQRRLLGGQHRGELVQGGLRRAVAAPALVRLDRGVRRDVQHRAGRCSARAGAAAWTRASGATTLTRYTCSQVIERAVGECRQRAGPEACSRC